MHTQSKNKAAAVKRKETREYGPQSKDPRVKVCACIFIDWVGFII